MTTARRPERRRPDATSAGLGRSVVIAALLAFGGAALLAGCGGAGDRSGDEAGAPEAMVRCGAAVLSALASRVHVKPDGQDGDGCGTTPAQACRTVQRGIDRCAPSGCGVLVRHGLYPTASTIALRDGVDVYGGCSFDGGPDRLYRTLIEASPAPGMPAVRATAVNRPTTVQGLVVVAKEESAGSTASLGVVVERSAGLALKGSVLLGGRGGAGVPGSGTGATGADGAPGEAGADGGAGGPACLVETDAAAGGGGRGGTDDTQAAYVSFFNWDCRSRDTGGAGGASGGGRAGGGLGPKGAHGIACSGRPHDAPGTGGPGGAGPGGECGAAAQPSPLSAGRFDGPRWIASRGDDGQPGRVGGGGGGGGAGGACVSETEGEVYTGLTGGGGGAGGCGGRGGGAAQQGGASIPLVLIDSPIAFDAAANAVVAGPGGTGGRGADGVAGGTGGGGGSGRSGPQRTYLGHSCPGTSGDGGAGGAGGAGSAGAGGHGGPSIGIALIGTTPALLHAEAIYAPQPGLPGRGGRSGNGSGGIAPGAACSRTVAADGAHGVAGLAVTHHDFATAPQNFLAGGQRLAPGQTRASLDGAGLLRLQPDGNLCLTRSSTALWCSFESGLGRGDELRMQTDGNLCLYTGGTSPACSGTSGHPGAYLEITADARLVVTDGTTTLWSRP